MMGSLPGLPFHPSSRALTCTANCPVPPAAAVTSTVSGDSEAGGAAAGASPGAEHCFMRPACEEGDGRWKEGGTGWGGAHHVFTWLPHTGAA